MDVLNSLIIGSNLAHRNFYSILYDSHINFLPRMHRDLNISPYKGYYGNPTVLLSQVARSYLRSRTNFFFLCILQYS